MADAVTRWLFSRLDRRALEHAVRTTVAAMVSLLVAGAFKLPQAYWAPITTLVVMQSTLGAALPVSIQRLAGNALGAVLGAILALRLGSGAMVFGVGVLVAGLICPLVGITRSGYRFTGITIGIVVLVASANPPWVIALHRFIEVSIGIGVGLGITGLWPERDETKSQPAHS